jgi:hypothetical protein
MKKLIYIVLLCLGFQSCDDGEVIFTNFDFDNVNLQYCGDVGDFVFFKIKTQSFETLALQLRTLDSILHVPDTNTYVLGDGTHSLTYRIFNEQITANYFCNAIPSTTPKVTSEYISTGGNAIVRTRTESDTVGPTVTNTYYTQIILANLRMESQNETIIQDTIRLGVIERVEVIDL